MNIFNIIKNKLNNNIYLKDIKDYGFQDFRFRIEFKNKENEDNFLAYILNNKNEGIINIFFNDIDLNTILKYKKLLYITRSDNMILLYFIELEIQHFKSANIQKTDLSNIENIIDMINYDKETFNLDKNILIQIYNRERKKYGYN